MSDGRLSLDPLKISAVIDEMRERNAVIRNDLFQALQMLLTKPSAEILNLKTETDNVCGSFDAELKKLSEVCGFYLVCEREIDETVASLRQAAIRT